MSSRSTLAGVTSFAAMFVLASCSFFGSTDSTGDGSGGGSPPPPSNQWWATCAAPSCPDHLDPPAVPCNGDERPGAPCAYAGGRCDPRLPCGVFLTCATEDPRADGCE